MRVAVCTIQRGREDRLLRQRALLQRAAVRHIVVSMDCGPSAATAVASGRLPVDDDAPLPLAAARNLAAQLAISQGAQLLVFLDVDCLPRTHTIARYAAAARRLPGAVLAGPIRYVGADASIEDAHAAAPHPARPAPAAGITKREHRYELLWSASFAISSQLWRSLGGFDEGYVGYGAEDTDFALRAERAGVPFYWVGGADVAHLAHDPQIASDEQLPALMANVKRFQQRWGYEPMPELLRSLRAEGRLQGDETDE